MGQLQREHNQMQQGKQVTTATNNQKANRRLFMLRSFKRFGFTYAELKTVYEGYIRYTLEYADVDWHSGFDKAK